jgi:hypothetical protein
VKRAKEQNPIKGTSRPQGHRGKGLNLVRMAVGLTLDPICQGGPNLKIGASTSEHIYWMGRGKTEKAREVIRTLIVEVIP